MTTITYPIVGTEAEIREKDRSITLRWDTGKVKPATQYEGEAKIMLTLNISHHKAGPNYWNGTIDRVGFFSASLSNETLRENGVISFVMGSGLGIEKRAQPRFSRKKMQEFADEMRGKIMDLVGERDPQIMPYINGEKAGLA